MDTFNNLQSQIQQIQQLMNRPAPALAQPAPQKIVTTIPEVDGLERACLEYKEERPELARNFLALAGSELEHMQILHNSVTSVIEEERRTNGEPPPGMQEAYDLIHEWQMERVAHVRNLIQMARE